MLHTKFCGNRSTISVKNILKRFFFTKYGHGGHFNYVNQMPRTSFRPPCRKRLYTKFGSDWPSGFGDV